MEKLFLPIIVLITALLAAHGRPLHHFQSLREACASIGNMQEPEDHRQMRMKCAEKIMGSRNQGDPIKKCFAILNLDDKQTMAKICQSPEENEAKFQEVKTCLDSSRPEPSLMMQFHECMHKAKQERYSSKPPA